MTEPQYVEITDRLHAQVVNRWIGKIEAMAAVEERAKEFDRLPGFGLAIALLQKELAEAKAIAVADNLRACARAGIDIAKTSEIHIETRPNGGLRLKVTMMDLADMMSEAGEK